MSWLVLALAAVTVWAAIRLAYQESTPKEVPPEPSGDPYGTELGRIRTVEGMREAAAHTCRLIARDAADKARVAHEMSRSHQLTEEERVVAANRHKAWLYTCEAAERCEREIRSLGLR